jgi:hypothetical protein
MAMDKRRRHTKETSMWVAPQDLPRRAAQAPPNHHFTNAPLDRSLDQSIADRSIARCLRAITRSLDRAMPSRDHPIARSLDDRISPEVWS